MYKKQFLIRFGDIMLKGKNQNFFKKRVYELVKDKLNGLNIEIIKTHDHIYIDIKDVSEEEVKNKLMLVTGLQSFSICYVTSLEYKDILETSVEIIQNRLNDYDDFKIQTKRSNKLFKYTSLEFTQLIAKDILNKFAGKLKVNVKNPKNILTIEIRENNTYIFLDTIKGLGGFPVGTSGYGVSMLSGGIDSPVSSFLAMKKGIEIDLLHFESTPLTPIESVDKVIKLAAKIAKYNYKNKINLLIVPFMDIHQEILAKVDDSYLVTIMRRSMYRIADLVCKSNKKYKVIINGESIGQVASQTLESMYVVEEVTKVPVIRPLSVMDKNDIIKISYDIDTYETSILPFQDCCTVYLPKNPATRPNLGKAVFYESNFEYEKLEKIAFENIIKLEIKFDKEFKLSDYGLTVKDAVESYGKNSI